jgi:hypothetical protein
MPQGSHALEAIWAFVSKQYAAPASGRPTLVVTNTEQTALFTGRL